MVWSLSFTFATILGWLLMPIFSNGFIPNHWHWLEELKIRWLVNVKRTGTAWITCVYIDQCHNRASRMSFVLFLFFFIWFMDCKQLDQKLRDILNDVRVHDVVGSVVSFHWNLMCQLPWNSFDTVYPHINNSSIFTNHYKDHAIF